MFATIFEAAPRSATLFDPSGIGTGVGRAGAGAGDVGPGDVVPALGAQLVGDRADIAIRHTRAPQCCYELCHPLRIGVRGRARIFRLADDLGLPVVATNDAHFLRSGDHDAHDVLLCIGLGKDREERDRMWDWVRAATGI